MPRERAAALAVVALLAALTTLALVRRPAAPAPPAKLPPARCSPWMADCMPGVGAKTRERAAAAVRDGDLHRLPPAARAWAAAAFAGRDER